MFDRLVNTIVTFIGALTWDWIPTMLTGKYFKVTDVEQSNIRDLLTKDYYIILTRRNTHLSTYAINFAHFCLTKRWGFYSHALMNLEDAVASDDDFRLIQATKIGVDYAGFHEVFDCDSVALLKPKNMELSEWTAAMDRAKQQIGKSYDTLYDLTNDQNLSCVELVRVALQSSPNYYTDFAKFEAMIAVYKNLDPHMFFECGDFEVAYEVRH